MKQMDVTMLLSKIGRLFKRFHTTVFIIAVVAGLAYAVISLSTLVTNANAGVGGTSTAESITFDTATMDQLKTLHTSEQIPTIELPPNRINPFSE